MRAGEVARRAGVNAATLRYYERRGLLPAPARTPSGHRHYDEDAVRFLRAIKEAQAIGFSLAEIEEYLRVARSGPASAALRTRAAAKIDEIDARIARLRRMRDELARIVGCACESLDHCTCGAAYLARRGREAPVRPSPLHVTNGDSAGNTLRQTALGGAVLPWQDVLHEGPVPAGPRRELLQARAAFLSACGWGSSRSILASLEDRDRQLVQALKDEQQVVLWFEHDLYDQLQLVDALALAAGAARPAEAANAPELVVVGSFPGRPDFRGLGELTADELETLWPPECRPVRTRWPRRSRSGPRCATPTRPYSPRPPRRTTPGCRSSRPRCSGCSRSCPPRATACPAPNGGRCRPSRRARPRRPPPSWPRRTWRPRRSSATRGSSARSPASAPARAAGRDAGRRPAAAAPAAGRRPHLRPAAAPANRPGPAGPGPPGGPGRAAGPGPLARRHAPHRGRRLALDPAARLLVRPA